MSYLIEICNLDYCIFKWPKCVYEGATLVPEQKIGKCKNPIPKRMFTYNLNLREECSIGTSTKPYNTGTEIEILRIYYWTIYKYMVWVTTHQAVQVWFGKTGQYANPDLKRRKPGKL